MPGPNLLDALRAHLQTGEVPESLRETLGGGVRTGTVQEGHEPQRSVPVGEASQSSSFDQWASTRRARGPRDAVKGSGAKLDISDLLGEGEVLDDPVAARGGTEPGGGDLVGVAGSPEAAPAPPAGDPAEAAVVGAGLVPQRVTPAGEVEPALPFLNPRTAHRYRKEDYQESLHTTRENYGKERRLTAVEIATSIKKGLDAHRAPTTDQTLAEDLAASLALGEETQTNGPASDGERHPDGDHRDDLGVLDEGGTSTVRSVVDGRLADTTCEFPTDLPSLPQFAYVCGAAGVGKTFWAKELARNSGDACVLCATTGIASVNLGEGTTINTYLKFYDTASLRESYTGGYLEAMLKKHRATGLERILLDEVSMMAGEQLTILTRAIDNVNQDRPEGVPELGLILLGDFAQLAPVPDRDPRDPRGFKKLPVAFAFESAEWSRYGEHTLKLTRIRRQADADFIGALQATRRGAVGEALAYFGPRMVQTTDMQFAGPTIVAKNDAVGKYNQLRLDAVKGAKVDFPSTRWGKVRPEWGGDPKPKHEWGVPEVLQLKEGCRVMILANKNIAGKGEPPMWAYTNGDLGTFLAPLEGGGGARVKLDRTGTEVLVGYLNRFNEIPLEPGRRKALKAEGHPERVSEDGKKEYIGGISYIPLRLAYATTVHKSQGLSLDQVQINIRDPFFAQSGMLYVALSRARSIEGLRLVGTPEGFRARCTVNPKLKGYL